MNAQTPTSIKKIHMRFNTGNIVLKLRRFTQLTQSKVNNSCNHYAAAISSVLFYHVAKSR